MTRSFGTPSAESAAFMRLEWGEPLTANLGGTTARADGSDPYRGVVKGMTTDPEPLDVRPFGFGAGILAPLQLDVPGLPLPFQDFQSDTASAAGFWSSQLPQLPEGFGVRVGFGALGLGLALIGAYALVRS